MIIISFVKISVPGNCRQTVDTRVKQRRISFTNETLKDFRIGCVAIALFQTALFSLISYKKAECK